MDDDETIVKWIAFVLENFAIKESQTREPCEAINNLWNYLCDLQNLKICILVRCKFIKAKAVNFFDNGFLFRHAIRQRETKACLHV